ncbi:MAG: PilZ domain-containing protein [Microvirga sp.]
MSELRSAARTSAVFRGRIIINGRSSTLECAVQDLSSSGAKLAFASPEGIPFEFDLEIPTKGSRQRARLVWRQGSICGVRFLAE